MAKEFVLKDEIGELRLVAGVEKTEGEEPVVVLTVCAPHDYIARSISLDEAIALGGWLSEAKALGEWLRNNTKRDGSNG